jgi:hypothetical protein
MILFNLKNTTDLLKIRRHMRFIPLISICLFVCSINAENDGWLLIGFNISRPVISKYDSTFFNQADYSFSMSFYELKSIKNGFRFDQGKTAGFEVNMVTGRLYFGCNLLLLSFMHEKLHLFPVLAGFSAKAIFEVGKYNPHLFNIGGEAGVWLNLGILGQLGFFERYMINTFSTRIEYGYRIPIHADRKSGERQPQK